VRVERAKLERTDEPDRRYDGEWAGLTGVDFVIVSAGASRDGRRARGSSTDDGWFRARRAVRSADAEWVAHGLSVDAQNDARRRAKERAVSNCRRCGKHPSVRRKADSTSRKPKPHEHARSHNRDMSSSPRIDTLGQLKAAIASGQIRRRPVRDEVRENLAERLKRKEALFPGIIGYDETVIPQLVNAVLARHHFICSACAARRRRASFRAMTTLLDEWLPVIPESEINDDPIAPLSAFGQQRVKAEGDQMPVRWLPREARYVEKLATPDVTIADMIGDIDPIKAAKGGLQLGSELSMHFGLLPRANRGIFAINELPDLAGKIQVGLFNILQEGDVQIKGYPVRLPLDVLIAFTANPEDYTARGKIITPLKDRIGAEIRTHYMQDRADALSITEQEAWVSRAGPRSTVPRFVREVVEEIAFQARNERKIDRALGRQPAHADQRLETAISNAERRALAQQRIAGRAESHRHLLPPCRR
jgi:Mg-chelatase subunit ChlI